MGTQTQLGILPLDQALSPDRSKLLVTNNGQGKQSLQLVDTANSQVLQTIEYASPEALYAGVVWSPDGTKAYASAGGSNKIRTYTVADGKLTEGTPIELPKTNPAGQAVNLFPAGLAISADGGKLYVADQLGDAMTAIDLATKQQATISVGHRPYDVTLTKDGRKAYVTNQGADTVSVVDVTGAEPEVTGTVKVGTHPNKAALDKAGRLLYVANGDSDSVSVVDVATAKVVRTINLAPYKDAQVGSAPSGLSLSEDGRQLYVANAGNNDIAVVDLASRRVRGLVPTGWYPTSVVALGDKLYVTNAKGLGAGRNDGPGQPDPNKPGSPDKYIGSMMKGTLSTISVPSNSQLATYTKKVVANNGFDSKAQAAGAVLPAQAGGKTPIKHVIYVVKENRTYDQVLGSLGKGAGDPSINLFGDESAPNTRQLSREFVTFDNFYADAEVSAQGWNWVVAANSNPYAEQQWPANYSGRKGDYPSEKDDDAVAPNRDPDNAYIWQQLAARGKTFRNYGFYVGSDANGKATTTDKQLMASTDPDFKPYDMTCPDSAGTFTPRSTKCGSPRIDEWLREFREYEKNGELPTVQFVRLPTDHTSGTRVGWPTPRAYVADNDWALGQLVEAVSKSKYWESTAIFVTQDDSQNGPDHIDAHRTLALVISPYTRTGAVDSTFYSTASMLRTIGQIVGLPPLTQFDALANPMGPAFSGRKNTGPYEALKPTIPLDEVNATTAPLAAESGKQDLEGEDRINEQVFNEAIWKSVKGADSEMPAPKHDLFGAIPNSEAEDLDD
ncbi:bifunctional YncE family protein/alkaline phosphatase family protein [Actinopolymorpha alba]|uniref:bifunctional YncE family protein/alkaline phosphatase family protein n=1 Tax=Actinopolymorpha alba TaxID=533267 RepID=UPI00039A19AF|nr:bifunctional YncE family protein/alkaline phosphatase family protein [Actinopolymorpha alba]